MVTTIAAGKPIVPGNRYNVATQYTSATRIFLKRESALTIEASDWVVVRLYLLYPTLPVSGEWVFQQTPVYGKGFTFVMNGTAANPQLFYLYFPRRSYLQSGTFSLYSDP